MMAMALLKNYQPFQAPQGLALGSTCGGSSTRPGRLTKRSTKKYGRTQPGPHVSKTP